MIIIFQSPVSHDHFFFIIIAHFEKINFQKFKDIYLSRVLVFNKNVIMVIKNIKKISLTFNPPPANIHTLEQLNITNKRI